MSSVPPSPRPRSERPWYKRKRVLIPAAVVASLLAANAFAGEPEAPRQPPEASAASTIEVATTHATTTTVASTTTKAPTTREPTTTRRVRAASPPTTRRRPPVTTSPQPDCHPSYPDVCLDPEATDYDCAGGSGNGPEYVRGPIRVLPPDPFDLDREGDGVGCES